MAEAAMHATGEAMPNGAFKNPQNRSYRHASRSFTRQPNHGPRDEDQLPSVDDLEVAAAAAESAMEAIRALEAVGGPLPFLSDDQSNGLPPLSPPPPPIPTSSIKVNFNVDSITDWVSLKLDLSKEKSMNGSGGGRTTTTTTAATMDEEDDAFCEDISLPSSSSSSSSSSDDESDLDIITDYADIRKMIDAMDKDDATMADDDIVDDDDDDGDGGDSPNTRKALNATNKTQASTDLFGDLPLPDVSQIIISPEDTLLPAGCIQAIVEGMVVVKAVDTPGVPPLNEGCVLVLETTRTAIGVIEDIFGPVTAPLYALRYNVKSDGSGNDGLVVGAAVASVDRLAHYIESFEELQVKGYDASEDDGMDPEVEFSDDEAEAEYKRQLKMKKRKDTGSGGGGGGRGRGRGRGRGEGGSGDNNNGGGMRRVGGGNRGPAQAFPSRPPQPPTMQQQQPPSYQAAPPQAGSAYHYQPWPPPPSS